ncbi:MAG: UrcA family protein [Steroidobacteraceae bacterium]|jgi:UrcA family protein
MNATTTATGFYSLIAASLAGILFASLAAQPASADNFEPLKVAVKFGDLDISHPQGAAILFRRINAAAHTVCSPFDHSGLSAKVRLDACVNKAVADAVATVNNPALYAVYSAKMRKTQPAQVASLR